MTTNIVTWTYNSNPVTGNVIAPVGAIITYGVNSTDNNIWINLTESNGGLTMQAVGTIASGTFDSITGVTLAGNAVEAAKSHVGTGGEFVVSFNLS